MRRAISVPLSASMTYVLSFCEGPSGVTMKTSSFLFSHISSKLHCSSQPYLYHRLQILYLVASRSATREAVCSAGRDWNNTYYLANFGIIPHVFCGGTATL